MVGLFTVEDENFEDLEEKNALGQALRGQILTQVSSSQGLVNDFDVSHDSIGEAEKIVKAIMSISESSYLVRQALAELRDRINIKRG